jgi:hypothetical protein
MLTNIALAERAQKRIADRVNQYIAVGVGDKAAIMGNMDPAEHQRVARPKAMYIVAMTYTQQGPLPIL